MRSLLTLLLIGGLFFVSGCASQDPVDSASTEAGDAESMETDSAIAQPTALEADGVAGFALADGSAVSDTASVSLSTGGGASGRLIPTSTDDSVTLYMTRDGSVPSADNNWGGAIKPDAPRLVTRQLEGSGVYKVIAELDGEYSAVTTAYVTWTHEESPSLDRPTFTVNGREVSGAVEIPVSDGSTATGRLYVDSNYAAATIYISRDGTNPTPDKFWRSQIADGTYLFSPQPTAASYRVIAVWQGAQSPVASLDVTWIE